jgi:hypothetical protein
MSKLFEALKAGFEEAIAHDQGKLELRTHIIHIPSAPAQYNPEEIKKVSEKK